MSNQPDHVKSLRLPEREVEKILDRLDAENAAIKRERRKHERHPHRDHDCIVRLVNNSGGTAPRFQVTTADLSAHGLAFLYGGFIHSDTPCFVTLTKTHGEASEVEGVIVGCAYVERGVHKVSVRFHTPLMLTEYCASSTELRVLLAEDDPSMAKLALHHLKALQTKVDHVVNGDEAVEKATASAYDLILMDMEMPVKDGFDAVTALRTEHQYTGPIVALTTRSTSEDHQRCLEVGCNQFYEKPLSPVALGQLIRMYREEPIYSTFQNDESMREMIVEFVNQLPATLKKLEAALEQSQSDTMEAAARDLKGAAGGFGFDALSVAAGVLETAAQVALDAERIRALLDDATHLCTLARSPGQ